MNKESIKNPLREQIEIISTLFYQRRDQEAWANLNNLIDLTIQFTCNVQDQKLVARINQGLVGVVEAMERKDTILIADELVHTIKPLLDSLGE